MRRREKLRRMRTSVVVVNDAGGGRAWSRQEASRRATATPNNTAGNKENDNAPRRRCCCFCRREAKYNSTRSQAAAATFTIIGARRNRSAICLSLLHAGVCCCCGHLLIIIVISAHDFEPPCVLQNRSLPPLRCFGEIRLQRSHQRPARNTAKPGESARPPAKRKTQRDSLTRARARLHRSPWGWSAILRGAPASSSTSSCSGACCAAPGTHRGQDTRLLSRRRGARRDFPAEKQASARGRGPRAFLPGARGRAGAQVLNEHVEPRRGGAVPEPARPLDERRGAGERVVEVEAAEVRRAGQAVEVIVVHGAARGRRK